MSAFSTTILATAAATAIATAPGISTWHTTAFATCAPPAPTTHQLTPREAAQLLQAARQLVTVLSALDDPRAAALGGQLRSMGVTPAISSGWRQQAHDLADTLLIVAGGDAAAMRVAVILAGDGISPTPADLRDPAARTAAADPGDAASGTPVVRELAPPTAAPAPPRASSTPAASSAPLSTAVRRLQHDQASTPARDAGAGVTSATTRSSDDVTCTDDTGKRAGPTDPTAAPTPTRPAPKLDPGVSDDDVAPATADWRVQQADLEEALADTDDPEAHELAAKLAALPDQQNDTSTPEGSTTTRRSSLDNPQKQLFTPTTHRSWRGSDDTSSAWASRWSSTDGKASRRDEPSRWEGAAQDLSDRLAPYTDDDPTARDMSDRLSDLGFRSDPSKPTSRDDRGSTDEDDNQSDQWRTQDEGDGVGESLDDPTSQNHDSADHADSTDIPRHDPSASPAGGDQPLTEVSNLPAAPAAPAEPAPPAAAPAAAPPPAHSSSPGVWDQLAQCESSGKWDINTGNGYHGGLQFDAATWRAAGGGQYAPTADKATKDQQIAVAEQLRAQRGGGYGSWPGCSRKLGLPQ